MYEKDTAQTHIHTYTHTSREYYSAIIKDEFYHLQHCRRTQEDIKLIETTQTNTISLFFHLNVEYKNKTNVYDETNTDS